MHKIKLEAFEASGALRIAIAVRELKPSSTTAYIDSTLHTNSLVEDLFPFLISVQNTIHLSLY